MLLSALHKIIYTILLSKVSKMPKFRIISFFEKFPFQARDFRATTYHHNSWKTERVGRICFSIAR